MIVEVGGRDVHVQGQAAALTDRVDLAAGFAAVYRAGPGQVPLLSARTCVLSKLARDQSICPASPSRSSMARCRAVITPGLYPLGEPAVRSAPVHRERARQLAPRAAGLQHVHDRREHRPVIGASAAAALMPLRMWRQERLREIPQRVRAVLLHVIHTRSTNNLETQQPLTTHGLSVYQRGKAAVSGLGEAMLDRALADTGFVKQHYDELVDGVAKRAALRRHRRTPARADHRSPTQLPAHRATTRTAPNIGE